MESEPVIRWASACVSDQNPRMPEARSSNAMGSLPDRVFFAYGACRILAYAFLEKFGDHSLALWLKPAASFTGNHIFIASTDWIFDYHGGKPRPVVVPPGCQVLVDTGQGNASGQQCVQAAGPACACRRTSTPDVADQHDQPSGKMQATLQSCDHFGNEA